MHRGELSVRKCLFVVTSQCWENLHDKHILEILHIFRSVSSVLLPFFSEKLIFNHLDHEGLAFGSSRFTCEVTHNTAFWISCILGHFVNMDSAETCMDGK